jgi:hypothetical protein
MYPLSKETLCEDANTQGNHKIDGRTKSQCNLCVSKCLKQKLKEKFKERQPVVLLVQN